MPCVSGRTNQTDAMEGDRGRPTLVWHKHTQGMAAVANQPIPPPPTRGPRPLGSVEVTAQDQNTAAWLLERSGLDWAGSDSHWKDPRMT